MNYHGIETDSMLNGDGLRVVLWLSGCTHHCKGCQNPQTWDENSGILFDEQAENELFEALKPDYISGLTISGGDGLYPNNRNEITKLVKKCKKLYSNKTIWIYTGFKYEEVKDLEIMQYIDVLVDGEFIEELADVNYPYAGSTNQKVIRLHKTKNV